MSTKKIAALAVSVIALVVGIVIFSMNISIENQEIDLRETTIAQNKKC